MEVYLTLAAPPLSAALRRAHDPLDAAGLGAILAAARALASVHGGERGCAHAPGAA